MARSYFFRAFTTAKVRVRKKGTLLSLTIAFSHYSLKSDLLLVQHRSQPTGCGARKMADLCIPIVQNPDSVSIVRVSRFAHEFDCFAGSDKT